MTIGLTSTRARLEPAAAIDISLMSRELYKVPLLLVIRL